MFPEFFVLGSAAFYALLVLFFLFFTACAAYDDYPGCTVLAVVVFFGIWFMWGDLGTTVRFDPYRLLWLPAWIAIGLAWSYPRWIIFLLRARDAYQRELRYYILGNNLPPLEQWTKDQLKAWRDSSAMYHLRCEFHLDYDVAAEKAIPPTFVANRPKMIPWVLLWPFSIFWTFCRDGLIRLVDWLTGLMGKIYQRLSDWVFKDV